MSAFGKNFIIATVKPRSRLAWIRLSWQTQRLKDVSLVPGPHQEDQDLLKDVQLQTYMVLDRTNTTRCSSSLSSKTGNHLPLEDHRNLLKVDTQMILQPLFSHQKCTKLLTWPLDLHRSSRINTMSERSLKKLTLSRVWNNLRNYIESLTFWLSNFNLRSAF